jgi:hypothetical protein
VGKLIQLRIVSAVAVLTVFVFAGVAAAAAPTKGGLYVGTISGTEKRLEVHVAKDGRSATAAMFCFKQKVGALRFPVAAGKFAAKKTTGSVVVWSIAGRFLTPTKARVSVALKTLCDGKGGLVTLKLKSS